ncbi:MAG: HEAT repeat domain-containing protein [Methanocorpusculum sp.]|nr:HEAT repeat domain-containing protein [Methanocorpusculum sp.]
MMFEDYLSELKSEKLEDRHAAVDRIAALASSDLEKYVPEIVSLLKKSDTDTRWYLGRALIKLGKDVIPCLIKESEMETDMAVQKYFASILAYFGEDAAEPLVKLFESENATSRGMAAAALEKIGDGSVIYLMEAVQSDNKTVSVCAGIVLAKLGVYDY